MLGFSAGAGSPAAWRATSVQVTREVLRREREARPALMALVQGQVASSRDRRHRNVSWHNAVIPPAGAPETAWTAAQRSARLGPSRPPAAVEVITKYVVIEVPPLSAPGVWAPPSEAAQETAAQERRHMAEQAPLQLAQDASCFCSGLAAGALAIHASNCEEQEHLPPGSPTEDDAQSALEEVPDSDTCGSDEPPSKPLISRPIATTAEPPLHPFQVTCRLTTAAQECLPFGEQARLKQPEQERLQRPTHERLPKKEQERFADERRDRPEHTEQRDQRPEPPALNLAGIWHTARHLSPVRLAPAQQEPGQEEEKERLHTEQRQQRLQKACRRSTSAARRRLQRAAPTRLDKATQAPELDEIQKERWRLEEQARRCRELAAMRAEEARQRDAVLRSAAIDAVRAAHASTTGLVPRLFGAGAFAGMLGDPPTQVPLMPWQLDEPLGAASTGLFAAPASSVTATIAAALASSGSLFARPEA